MQLRKLEILAPAKNRGIGIAAINCGADSLYIAGPAFGAREAAGNSFADIEKLTSYARKFGVKVYVVINTILYQNELEQAVSAAKTAYESGADALIVQDLGLLETELPPLPLFASTQTNIRSAEQAQLLESLGFSRLILARELSLEQITQIRAATSIELESFVHGALCVSYSGQCYISSRLTGRSGNRGECAQICRNNFDLVNNNGGLIAGNKPLLSLKDLNLAGFIPQLANAGITSFKIEGRLKDESYVKNIVRYYRKITDSFLESDKSYAKASYGTLYGGFTPRPQNTFNRGFTTLFADGKRGMWNSGRSAKGTGEKLGVVKDVSFDKHGNLVFSHDSGIRIVNGDGLCIVTPDGIVQGLRANVAQGNVIYTNHRKSIPKGSVLYRNYDKEFEKELETNMPERVMEARIVFQSVGDRIVLDAQSEDGKRVSLVKESSFETAKDSERAKMAVYNQLQKRAGLYKFVVASYKTDKQKFYPVSFLNECRREIAALLECGQAETATRPFFSSVPAKTLQNKPLQGRVLDYRYNIANSKSKELYQKLGAQVEGMAFEISAPEKAELMRCKYCIKYELGICPHHVNPEVSGDASKAVEPLWLENGSKRFRLGFDCGKCEMIIFG